MSAADYKLMLCNNKSSRYKHVVIRSYPGYFNYHFCKAEDVEKYSNDLPKLYRISKDNR